jgi:hypothetical protein
MKSADSQAHQRQQMHATYASHAGNRDALVLERLLLGCGYPAYISRKRGIVRKASDHRIFRFL